MTPIGRGQRELIIGDRKTGKTAIAIDAIINQRDSGVKCFYVAIGQKESTVAGVIEKLRETRRDGLHDGDRRRRQRPCPAAIRRALRRHRDGRALHVRRPARPDRVRRLEQASRGLSPVVAADASSAGPRGVPGDVFYCHSRCSNVRPSCRDALGGGSLTSLPIIETLEGEVSAYIPTNVISITDGQIYLQPDLFFAGVKPAMNVGISVSRVGGAAQIKAMKKVAGGLRLDLAAFRELEAFAQMGTDLDAATQARLDRGYRMVEILKQGQYQPLNVVDEIFVIYAGTRGHLDKVPVNEVQAWEKGFLEFMQNQKPEVRDELATKKDLTDDLVQEDRSRRSRSSKRSTPPAHSRRRKHANAKP